LRLWSRNDGFTLGDAKIKFWHDDWGMTILGMMKWKFRHFLAAPPIPSYPDLR
jgi:hypothetical protein